MSFSSRLSKVTLWLEPERSGPHAKATEPDFVPARSRAFVCPLNRIRKGENQTESLRDTIPEGPLIVRPLLEDTREKSLGL